MCGRSNSVSRRAIRWPAIPKMFKASFCSQCSAFDLLSTISGILKRCCCLLEDWIFTLYQTLKKERKKRGLLAICFHFFTSDNWKLRLSSETWGESNLVPFARCWDAYHLHGKPGNSSWKIKWYASFHLEYF